MDLFTAQIGYNASAVGAWIPIFTQGRQHAPLSASATEFVRMHSAIRNILRPMAIAIGLSMLYGCASVPPPVQELEVATAALASARASGAPQHAADQWQLADDKFATARQLLEKKQNNAARRALQQATVDAKLAQAKAQMQQRDAEQRALQEEISQLKKRIEAVELGAE